ncbi:hypothetical protein MRX96_019183 [Rhipicephalus microplus]
MAIISMLRQLTLALMQWYFHLCGTLPSLAFSEMPIVVVSRTMVVLARAGRTIGVAPVRLCRCTIELASLVLAREICVGCGGFPIILWLVNSWMLSSWCSSNHHRFFNSAASSQAKVARSIPSQSVSHLSLLER